MNNVRFCVRCGHCSTFRDEYIYIVIIPPEVKHLGKKEIAEALGMPKDVVLGMPLITMTGNMRVNVENFKSIESYECQSVRLLTKKGCMEIRGRNLEIEYYDEEQIQVRGIICSIEYIN